MDKPEDKEKIGWLFLMLAFLFVIVAWGATWYLFNDIE